MAANRLQLCAISLWRAQAAARAAFARRDNPAWYQACLQIQAIHRHATAPSLRRCAESTLASLAGLGLPPLTAA